MREPKRCGIQRARRRAAACRRLGARVTRATGRGLWPGPEKTGSREFSVASTTAASIIAKLAPMQTRGPPLPETERLSGRFEGNEIGIGEHAISPELRLAV